MIPIFNRDRIKTIKDITISVTSFKKLNNYIKVILNNVNFDNTLIKAYFIIFSFDLFKKVFKYIKIAINYIDTLFKVVKRLEERNDTFISNFDKCFLVAFLYNNYKA